MMCDQFGPVSSHFHIFSQGKTALHLVSLGGAHGWTANLERQESLKDFRAVAFEAVHYHSNRQP